MSANKLVYAHGEDVSDIAPNSIGSGDLSITVNTISKFNSNGGPIVINRGASDQEYAICSGVSGSSLTISLRGAYGSTAVAHNANAVIESVPFAHAWNDVIDTIKNGFSVTDGTVDQTKLVKAPASIAQGDVVYYNGSAWARLPAGTNGQFLQTQGASANPQWASNVGGNDAWIADSNTWTYSSVDGATGIVTINADLTGTIQAGDRIKFTQTTVKYFIVTKTPTFGAGNTTLTFYGGTDYTLVNAAISSPSYSHAKSPFGFNTDPSKWTLTLRDVSDRSQGSPVTGTWYNLGSLSLDIHIGAWKVWYKAALQANATASVQIFTTLSTANNSESDIDLTSRVEGLPTSVLGFTPHEEKVLVLTSKTTYFLNAKVGNTSTNLSYLGSTYFPTIVKAVCAFL